LRVNYKSFPVRNRGVPEQTKIWRPILTVKLIHHHATSTRFDAVVDTGSDYCLFDANIAARIGIKVVSGPEGDVGGIIGRSSGRVYYHNVKLVVGTDIVDIKAGFSWDLTENILGYHGFFDQFRVTLDATFELPYFDIDRILRH
jgi:hypothetical protein